MKVNTVQVYDFSPGSPFGVNYLHTYSLAQLIYKYNVAPRRQLIMSSNAIVRREEQSCFQKQVTRRQPPRAVLQNTRLFCNGVQKLSKIFPRSSLVSKVAGCKLVKKSSVKSFLSKILTINSKQNKFCRTRIIGTHFSVIFTARKKPAKSKGTLMQI